MHFLSVVLSGSVGWGSQTFHCVIYYVFSHPALHSSTLRKINIQQSFSSLNSIARKVHLG